MATDRDLDHIQKGLRVAGDILTGFVQRGFTTEHKGGAGPVTEADLAVDAALADRLPQPGDGWLSEETADDARRLECRRVWVVDPLDGTKEFVAGVPEWCVSIGLVEDGVPTAGGIFNPLTDELILGSIDHGVTLNGTTVRTRDATALAHSIVLASRSEIRRGEWAPFDDDEFTVKGTGSIAYKLGLVAAGRAEATWTLVPKSEWDIAAGIALVRGAGGDAILPDGTAPRFNRPHPELPGLIASSRSLLPAIRERLGIRPS